MDTNRYQWIPYFHTTSCWSWDSLVSGKTWREWGCSKPRQNRWHFLVTVRGGFPVLSNLALGKYGRNKDRPKPVVNLTSPIYIFQQASDHFPNLLSSKQQRSFIHTILNTNYAQGSLIVIANFKLEGYGSQALGAAWPPNPSSNWISLGTSWNRHSLGGCPPTPSTICFQPWAK